jgi:hypothetical protein
MTSVVACLLLGEAGVQIWYRTHDSPVADSHWSVRWPTDQPAYRHLAIAPETEGILRYNEGGGARWKDADDRQWLLYFFQWFPGQTAARFVKIHRPDICLPAAGLTMVGDQGLRLLEVNGVKLPVRSYRFDNQGTPLHVFYCYWDARSTYDNTRTAVEEDWTPWGRVRAALRGRREMGARMMELVVSGYENDSEANAALQREVSKIVVHG